ncbi:MAG: chromate transporter, partial [Clostridia bacterium]|nr:chromate transporter [Clostridia bacterium]
MADWSKLRKLFTSTFCISAFTVGGGAVIVPLLQ